MGFSFIIIIFFIIAGFYGNIFNYYFFIFYFVENLIEFNDTDKLVEINGSLLNGLLSIHPWLLFISYAFLVYFLLVSSSSLFNLYFSDTVFFKSYNNFLFIIVFAIVLGSLWAQQELNWGGWWGWDPVEVSALFILIMAIYFLHLQYLFFELNSIRILFFIIFLFFFNCVRKSFFFSVHDFLEHTNNEIHFTVLIAHMFWCLLIPLLFRIKQNTFFTFFYFILIFFLSICFKGLLGTYYQKEVDLAITPYFVMFFYIFSVYWLFDKLNIIYFLFSPFFFNITIFTDFIFYRASLSHIFVYVFFTILFFFKCDSAPFDTHRVGRLLTFSTHENFFWGSFAWVERTIAPNLITSFFVERFFYFSELAPFYTEDSTAYQVDVFNNVAYTHHFTGFMINITLFTDGFLPCMYLLFLWTCLVKK